MERLQPSSAAAVPGPGGFVAGLLYPLRALGVLQRYRQLWQFVLVPIVLNVVFGTLIYAGLLFAGLGWINGVIAGLPDWMEGGVALLLQLVLVLVLLVVLGFVLLQFGVILGSPWYGQLSEKLELQLTGSAPPAAPLTFGGILYDLGRTLGFEAKKLVLLAGIGIPLLLLGLVPAVGPFIFTAGSSILGATMACLDFFDPSLERRRLRFRAKLATIRRSLPASAGFGFVCFGLTSIPFVNLLAIPLCITAGTLFFCERIKSDLA